MPDAARHRGGRDRRSPPSSPAARRLPHRPPTPPTPPRAGVRRPPRRPRRARPRRPASRSPSPTTKAPAVTLAKAAPEDRVAHPGTTETAFALGAGDRLVGVDDFDDYPPRRSRCPVAATFTGVDIEKIVGLGADLVLAGGNGFNPPDALAKLRSLGIPVLVVYARRRPRACSHDIDLVGQAVGEDDGRSRPHRLDAGRLRPGRAPPSPALPEPRTFYEIDATGGDLRPGRRVVPRRDDHARRRRRRSRPATPTTSTSRSRSSSTADPEVIVLGDAAYGATPEIVAGAPGLGDDDRGEERRRSGRSTTSSSPGPGRASSRASATSPWPSIPSWRAPSPSRRPGAAGCRRPAASTSAAPDRGDAGRGLSATGRGRALERAPTRPRWLVVGGRRRARRRSSLGVGARARSPSRPPTPSPSSSIASSGSTSG